MSNSKFDKLLRSYTSAIGEYVVGRANKDKVSNALIALEDYVEPFLPCDGCGYPEEKCKCEPKDD